MHHPCNFGVDWRSYNLDTRYAPKTLTWSGRRRYSISSHQLCLGELKMENSI